MLLADIHACDICDKYLPFGPRPVIQFDSRARVLIAGQAPGKRVHQTGVPFDDPSGNRLRDWLGIGKSDFYNAQKIAILPMGFCFPGTGPAGDLAPRPECEPAWRSQLLSHLHHLQLTLVIGKYAQDYHFGNCGLTVTDIVKSWQTYWPAVIPLPHPSPRNNRWFRNNTWFETELVPALRKRMSEVLEF